MEWLEGYFEKEEQIDLENWLRAEPIIFNGKLQQSAETKYGTCVDIVAQNIEGIYYNVELKTREPHCKYNTYFIELTKWTNMMTLWRNYGVIPLYVNFVGDEVYVWNLARIIKAEFKANIKIWKGDALRETVDDRIGLYVENAWVYSNGKKIADPTGISDKVRGTVYNGWLCPKIISNQNIFTIWEKRDLQ